MRVTDLLPLNQMDIAVKANLILPNIQVLRANVTKQTNCYCEFSDLTVSSLGTLTSTWSQRFNLRQIQHCSEDR